LDRLRQIKSSLNWKATKSLLVTLAADPNFRAWVKEEEGQPVDAKRPQLPLAMAKLLLMSRRQ